jgi:hypothetical protein
MVDYALSCAVEMSEAAVRNVHAGQNLFEQIRYGSGYYG